MKKRKRFCNEDCNNCPLLEGDHARELTYILNKCYDKFGEEFYKIIEHECPNLTCCPDCRVDDFCHFDDCKIVKKL